MKDTPVKIVQGKPLKVYKSSDVLMSPRKVIKRLENIIQKYGKERALKSGSFQKAREAWVASVFMLGMSQLTKRTYWVQENEIPQDDPDIFVYNYREPQGHKEIGVVKEIQPVEICEYTTHTQDGLVDHIKSKLKNMFYHPETILICYIQRPGEAFRIIDIINGLKDIKTSVREIWLLFTTAEPPLSNFTIARVYLKGMNYPEMLLNYKGDYLELCKIEQPDFLRDSKGVQKTIIWNPSGESVVVPLPEDKSKHKR